VNLCSSIAQTYFHLQKQGTDLDLTSVNHGPKKKIHEDVLLQTIFLHKQQDANDAESIIVVASAQYVAEGNP
jgi:hypothetical protein